ncbi:MAG TPA: thiamine pyrophosphate-dependent enzyme [Pyrinomonadaceae bacterium]|nr:thiamine pyrophosphate-dependent enzyme [Pyrinomonadaceae bacterium]
MINPVFAMTIFCSMLKNELVVTANGLLARVLFAVGDRHQNLYMLGSMGLASSIGLGVSLAQPLRRVVVLDGDGNLLMALSTLAMVAERGPANFLHIVFDNEVYSSTGGQRSISGVIELDAIAAAAGYKWVNRVTKENELQSILVTALHTSGPAFLLIKVSSEIGETPPRINLPPPSIALRFRKSATDSAGDLWGY